MGESGTTPVSSKKRLLEGKSALLTLEYSFALMSSIVAVLMAASSVTMLFALWNDAAAVVSAPLSWMMPITSGYVGIIISSLMALVAGLVATILFKRVSRSVAERKGYTKRLSYKVATYGAFAILATYAAVLGITLVAILLSSLVLIGSESSIGSLYLREFLPTLIAFIIAGMSAYWMYKIVKGINKSGVWALSLLGVGAAILVAAIVTVAVAAHDDWTVNDYGLSTDHETRRSTSIDKLPSFDW